MFPFSYCSIRIFQTLGFSILVICQTKTGFSSFVKKSNFTPDFSNIPINPHFKIFKDRVDETVGSFGDG